MDGQNVLVDTTNYAASVVATGNNNELNDIKPIMKQLADSITAQSATVESLSTNMNKGIRSTGKTTDNKKSNPCLHVCVHTRDTYVY